MKKRLTFPVRRREPKPGTLAWAKQVKRAMVSAAQMSIRGEIDHIVERAMVRDGRIVTLSGLVFFSTATQDAWMLDAVDGMAAPLCRGGGVLPAPLVEETSTRFAIDWPLDFRLEDEAFVTEDRNTGRTVRVLGYPVEAIAGALRQARETASPRRENR
jgi:hypothetical protein